MYNDDNSVNSRKSIYKTAQKDPSTKFPVEIEPSSAQTRRKKDLTTKVFDSHFGVQSMYDLSKKIKSNNNLMFYVYLPITPGVWKLGD